MKSTSPSGKDKPQEKLPCGHPIINKIGHNQDGFTWDSCMFCPWNNMTDQIRKVRQDAVREMLERVEYRLKTYVWDANIGEGDSLIEVMENRKLLNKFVLGETK